MSMFLLAACMKWFPPIANRSPSPLITATCSSGFASFIPVARAIGRPCVVWKESMFKYPATLPIQPIPETTTILSMSKPNSSMARTKQFIMIPHPHPAHHIGGNLSNLKYLASGCITKLSASLNYFILLIPSKISIGV